MARLLGLALCVSLLFVVGATLIGRAIDTEVQAHVVFTRDGVTLDCERITDVAGRVFYDSCVRVP